MDAFLAGLSEEQANEQRRLDNAPRATRHICDCSLTRPLTLRVRQRAEYDKLHAPKAAPTWAADYYPGKCKPIEGSVKVKFDFMTSFMQTTFEAMGVPADQAAVCAGVLIEADLRGIDSHGIGRLKPIYCDRIDQGILKPTAPITTLKETDATALVDGGMAIGLYVGPHCMKMAIEKAKKHGVGVVFAQNSTHYGIAGYYATMASEAGCVGFSTTNARPSIAPTFGVEGMMGTNPLCFGIPTDEEFPFVIDCATSVNQRGKIERYGREGKETPAGQVIDLEGNQRTDTEGILLDMVAGKAALCPLGGAGEEMGGYKGFGWAATVELLCTAFQSGPWGADICGIDRATGAKKPMPLGHVFIAIDIEPIVPLDKFKSNSGEFLRAVRASAKDPKGPGRIWTAGEPEFDARNDRTANGGFWIPPALQKNMADLRAAKFSEEDKAKFTPFPFEK